MFTTASKLFLSITLIAVVSAVAYSLTTDGVDHFGFWTFMSLGVAGSFLAFVSFRTRDVTSTLVVNALSAADAEGRYPAGQGTVPTAWPVLGAFGVALAAIGLVVGERLFVLGVLVAVVAMLEWMVQSWADRASADREYNRELRNRIFRPVEYPVLGLVVAAFVVLGFSRVLLAVPKLGSVVIFATVATVVFLIAIVVASGLRISKQVITGLLVVGAVAVLAGGIAGAVAGTREIEEHDEVKGTESVSSRAGVLATITAADGSLDIADLTVPKATPLTLLFNNREPEKARLVIETALADDGTATSTQASLFTEPDKQGSVTFRINSGGEYRFYVETEGGGRAGEGTITVPPVVPVQPTTTTTAA